jgi:hypothetical protein
MAGRLTIEMGHALPGFTVADLDSVRYRIPKMPRKKRRAEAHVPSESEADIVSNSAQPDEEKPTSAKARSFVARSRTGDYASDPELRERLPDDILQLYECHQWKHAGAIMATDFPDELNDIVSVLRQVKLKKSFMTLRGGG